MIKKVLVLASFCLLVLAAPAAAQSAPQTGSNAASVDEGSGTITSTASGYQPGATVTFTIASTPTLLGTATASGQGVASITKLLPAGIEAGQHTITASGIGLSGGQLVLTTQVFVSQIAVDNASRTRAPAATAPAASLPRTGSDSVDLVPIGVLLVAFGGAVVLFTRRRRTQPTA